MLNFLRYRRVTPMERYAMVAHSIANYHADAVVEGIGPIDERALRAALAHAARANPGMRMRYAGALGASYWIDSGFAPPLRIFNDIDWDGTSERGAGFLATGLHLRGPVADVFVAYCTDGRTRIVFRGLHAALDGRSMFHWIGDVFRALRGEPLAGSGCTLTDIDVQRRYRDAFLAAGPPPAPPARSLPIVQPGPAQRPLRYIWRRVVIERRITNLIGKSAVFFANWARRAGTGAVSFTVPVDYRLRRIPPENVGNLTGYLRLVVDDGDTPRDVNHRLLQRIRAYGDCREIVEFRKFARYPIAIAARGVRANFERTLRDGDTPAPSGGLVSLGNGDLEDARFDGFHPLLAYPLPTFVGRFSALMLETPTSTVITISVPAICNDRGQFDELIAALQTSALA